MKTNSWTRRQFRQMAGAGVLLAGVSLVGLASANAQQTNAPANSGDSAKSGGAKTTDADAPELNNWVDVGVGGNIVSGDKAQFQRQSGLPASVFGGITGFHYELPLGKKGTFFADGRGMFDNHDYDLKLEAADPELGYVRAGFRQYREYSDGSGGFLPSNGSFFSLANNELALDRGTIFFESGLTLPDLPVFKLRYEHDYRSGEKDSTEWGTTTLTPGAAQKRLTPAYLMLDEKTDTVSADVTQALKNTDLGLGVRYVWESVNDSGVKFMQPGEGTASRVLTQAQQSQDDFFNAHAFTDTRFGEKLQLTTGYEYTTLRSTIGGSRTDNPAVPTTTDTRFVNLAGGSDLDQYAMNVSMMYSPNDNWSIVPAFRVEKEDLTGANTDNGLTTVAGVNTVGAQNSYQDTEGKLNLAESLDCRYVGITNFVFYIRAEWAEDRSHLTQDSGLAPVPPTILDTEWHQTLQKYSAGMNWYPERGLNFSLSFYHRIDDNNYDDAIPVTPTTYPGYIHQENFIEDGASLRGTWRPCSQLTLVSRYDFKYSTVDMRGGPLLQVPIANTTEHMFGETVSWTPLNRLFVQLSANYVLDTTHTPAEALSGGSVLPSQNNYWTITTLIGYAFDDKTDAQVGYVYYRSADYVDNSLAGVPYGAGAEEHTITATLGRQIRRNLRATLRYAFASYRDQLFGGNLDYHAHTILATMQYRF